MYYYLCSYVGRYSKFYFPGDKPWGCDHQDDFTYLFNVPEIGPIFTFNDPENVMVERMTRFWVNFIKTG